MKVRVACVAVGTLLAIFLPHHPAVAVHLTASPARPAAIMSVRPAQPEATRSYWREPRINASPRAQQPHRTHAPSPATPVPSDETPRVWLELGDCEASGDATADTGNGYYGLFQFSLSTWASFGGKSYASSPVNATVRQQLVIARRVLAAQGVIAWPVCGPRVGLVPGS